MQVQPYLSAVPHQIFSIPSKDGSIHLRKQDLEQEYLINSSIVRISFPPARITL